MKVIDLKKTTIYVDDIQRIYIEPNYSPERYNIQTTNGTFLVDREDYFKVKDYLLSLNDEVEIIEEDKKIEKLDLSEWSEITYQEDWDLLTKDFNRNSCLFVKKINEIIDYINGSDKE